MYYIKTVCGYCPQQECEYEIDIRYNADKILGNINTQYKKTLEYCEYANEYDCKHTQNSLCPILLEASKEP